VLRPKLAVRWLGYWVDSRLKFDTHVNQWSNKAYAAATHLRSLSKTVRGIPPAQAAVVARACVNQVALYGCEVWKRLYKLQVGLVQKVDKLLR